jgi:hypothetical protein
MNETDRPHRALEKIDRALAMVAALCKPRETEGAREWIMSIPAEPDRDPDLVIADALHAARAALAPEQRGDAEPEHFYDRPDIYRIVTEALNRIPYIDPHDDEDWLVDVVVLALKRGPSSIAALAAPPQEGERQPVAWMLEALDDEGRVLNVAHFPRFYPGNERPGHGEGFRITPLYPDAAPTPDREALHKKLYSVLIAYAENRLTLGEAADRILATLAAPPPREPDWLREYEWRKLALIEAATICGRDGSNPEQDAAERALDEWVLAALPGGRERDIKQLEAAVADLICPWCSSRWTPPKWAARPEDWVHCPKCYCSFSFNPPAAAPQASADTRQPERECFCHRCVEERERDIPLTQRPLRMIVCEHCGNKRCPHASDHRHACTGSNEPDQPGSIFGGVPGASADTGAGR